MEGLCTLYHAVPLWLPFVLGRRLQQLVRVFSTWTVARGPYPCYQLSRRCCSPVGWCFPTHRCGSALDIILTSGSLPLSCYGSRRVQLLPKRATIMPPFLASDHMLCSCHRSLPQALSSTGPDLTSTMFVTGPPCSTCHPGLTTWHQSVLAFSSHPCPDIPRRTAALGPDLCDLHRCGSTHRNALRHAFIGEPTSLLVLTSDVRLRQVDAPFSNNELVAALSKCHEVGFGRDCVGACEEERTAFEREDVLPECEISKERHCGMTTDHVRPLLDSTRDTHLLFSVAEL